MVWRYWEPNYYLQNEVYIKELMKRHGKDIEFVGFVMDNNVMKIDGKDAMSMMAATLCKETLKADCVIVNKSGMGHCQLDSALAFNWAEKMGITLFEHRNRDEVFKAPFYQYLRLSKTVRFRSAALVKDGRNVGFTTFLLFFLFQKS